MKAFYARLSDDVEASGLGVERQAKDCRALAALRQWEVEGYVDNDKSAYQRKVTRPRFEDMLRDVRAGRIDGMVVYNLDRLARQPKDLERVIDLYEDNPALTFATVEGDMNLSSPDGRTMARVMVAFANKSSADTGRRTKRKHLELAEAGEPVGRRMFGWMPDKRTLDPVEAKLGRKAVDEVIAGKGTRLIVREWNEAGVKTTTGKTWAHQSLRNWLLNPRLAGWRTRYGKIVLDSEGRQVRGAWEPLLDQDTFDRLQLAIGPVVSGRTKARRGARKYPLTGLLRCGVCHGFMYGSNAREEGRFNYICNTNGSSAEGRHVVSVSGVPVDALVFELTYLRITSHAAVEPGSAPWSGSARLAEIDAQVTSLMAGWQAGQLPERVVFPRVEALEEERSEMQNSRTKWLIETTGPAVREETPETWAATTVEMKRATADKYLSAVYIKPVTRQTAGRLDPARVVPVWREDQPLPEPAGG